MGVAWLFIISAPIGKGLPRIHVQIMMWMRKTEKKKKKNEARQEVEEITPAMSLNFPYLSFPTNGPTLWTNSTGLLTLSIFFSL